MPDPNKLALIIGMDVYYTDGLDSLPSCKKDADDMFKVLQDMEYTIIDEGPIIGSALDKEYGWTTVRKKIDYFFANAKPSQQLLFYFSGHGIHGGDQIFLATPQIDLKSPSTEGYSLADLTKHMGDSKSKRIIGIVDACYSGDAGLPHPELKKKSAKDNVGRALAKYDKIWKNTPKIQGINLLLSSQAYEESNAIKNSNSLYTKYLIEGLKGVKPQSDKNGRIIKESGSVDENGDVTPASLHEYVRNKVANETDQVPSIESNDPTGIILVSYPEKAPKKPIDQKQQFSEVIDPEVQNLFDQARRLTSVGRWVDAIVCYDKILTIDKNNVSALLGKGIALGEKGEFDEAIKQFEKALEIDDTCIPAIWNKGRALTFQGNFDGAIKCFDKVLESKLDNSYRADVLVQQGIAYAAKKDVVNARDCYNKSLALDPTNYLAMFNIAKGYFREGNLEDSLEWLNKSLKTNSDFTDGKNLKKKVLCRMGDALAESGKQVESLSYYDAALEIDENDEDVLNNKGYALFELKQYENAIGYFEKVLRINSNNSRAQTNKDDAYAKLAQEHGLVYPQKVRIRCKACGKVSTIDASYVKTFRQAKKTICGNCGQIGTMEEF